MRDDIGKRVIVFLDPDGQRRQVSYDELMLDVGVGEPISLTEALREEAARVAQFQKDSDRLAKDIQSLAATYRAHDRTSRAWHAETRHKTRDIATLPYRNRLKLLREYFCVDRRHVRVMDELESYVLAGTEWDHSAHMKSLIRFTIDYVTCVMKDVPRRSNRPCAMHSLSAAQGLAKNGQSHITIIGTLLHDVLEERVDLWRERFVAERAGREPYASSWDRSSARAPKKLAQRILVDHHDEVQDRSAAIYFAIGLALYDHVRKMPQPERYHQTLNAIMDMVAKLSRTSDVSYYQYLQNFLYPRNEEIDTIRRSDLVRMLDDEFEDAGALLDAYLENVEGFYNTRAGVFLSRDEIRRNVLREILAKIADRMNNTRDMERDRGFSIPSRLYGAGFKNIYFVHALEHWMRLPEMPGNERRLLSVKFAKKPKLSALYQIIEDIEELASPENFGPAYVETLERELESYKLSPEFRTLTPPKQGGLFDGTIYFFNQVTLGQKGFLRELESQPQKQVEYLVAFRAVLESFLVYAAYVEAEERRTPPGQTRWRPYSIEGMGPRLSYSQEEGAGPPQVPQRSFRRRVI